MKQVNSNFNILAVDTSTQRLSMSLYLSNNKTFSLTKYTPDHSENLTKFLDKLLKKANIKIDDINYVGVNTGPGSFTGLRVGLSFVKTLAKFLKVKVITTTTFDMLLFAVLKNCSNKNYNVTVLFPSVKNEFYFCKYLIKDKQICHNEPPGYIKNVELKKLYNTDIIAFPDFVNLEDQKENFKKVMFTSRLIIQLFLDNQKQLYKLISYKSLFPVYIRHTYY